MPEDFRISNGFFNHPKCKLLKRRLGSEAVLCLIYLWSFCSENKPTGNLAGMTVEEIETAVDWNGEFGAFVKTLIELKWVDEAEDGTLTVHDWVSHNPYVAYSDERSDKARFSRLAQIDKEAHKRLKAQGVTKITAEEMASLANRRPNAGQMLAPIPPPSPSPSPSPNPSHIHTTTDSESQPKPYPLPQPPPPGEQAGGVVAAVDSDLLQNILKRITDSSPRDKTPAAYEDVVEFYSVCFGEPSGPQAADLQFVVEKFKPSAIADVLFDAGFRADKKKNPARWIRTTLTNKGVLNIDLYLNPDLEQERLFGL